jgi:hypothetical protein
MVIADDPSWGRVRGSTGRPRRPIARPAQPRSSGSKPISTEGRTCELRMTVAPRGWPVSHRDPRAVLEAALGKLVLFEVLTVPEPVAEAAG